VPTLIGICTWLLFVETLLVGRYTFVLFLSLCLIRLTMSMD